MVIEHVQQLASSVHLIAVLLEELWHRRPIRAVARADVARVQRGARDAEVVIEIIHAGSVGSSAPAVSPAVRACMVSLDLWCPHVQIQIKPEHSALLGMNECYFLYHSRRP